MAGVRRETWEISNEVFTVAVDDHNNLPDAITQSLVDVLTREFPDQILDIIEVDEEGRQRKAVLQLLQPPAEGVYMASNATNMSFIRDIVYARRKEMDAYAVTDVVTSGTFLFRFQDQDEPLCVGVGGTSKQGILTSEGARKVRFFDDGLKSVHFVGPLGMQAYDMLMPMTQWKEMVRDGFMGINCKVALTVKGRYR